MMNFNSCTRAIGGAEEMHSPSCSCFYLSVGMRQSVKSYLTSASVTTTAQNLHLSRLCFAHSPQESATCLSLSLSLSAASRKSAIKGHREDIYLIVARASTVVVDETSSVAWTRANNNNCSLLPPARGARSGPSLKSAPMLLLIFLS